MFLFLMVLFLIYPPREETPLSLYMMAHVSQQLSCSRRKGESLLSKLDMTVQERPGLLVPVNQLQRDQLSFCPLVWVLGMQSEQR